MKVLGISGSPGKDNSTDPPMIVTIVDPLPFWFAHQSV
jgi:hypothetical protein